MSRNGLNAIRPDEPVNIAILPGFLYKNQRLGKSPPKLQIFPLINGPSTLCPVRTLAEYLCVSGFGGGALFRNTKSGNSLHPTTVSKILCEVIEEASPSSFPRAHEVRTSLAWTRGLPQKR